MIASTPIDDFLAGGSTSASGERLEAFGAGVALGGIVLAVGLIIFLAAAFTGERREVAHLLRLVTCSGALILAGGIIEVAGTADVLGLSWSTALTDGAASSAMMRTLAGLLMVFGFAEETVPAGGLPGLPGVLPDASEHGVALRWYPGASSAMGLAGASLGVMSFAFDGHTATEGPRIVHAAVNAVHVVAGGAWVGGVVALLVVGVLRRRRGSIGPVLVRFSPIATFSLAAVAVAGAVMAILILDDVGELTSTDWGRRLLVKTGGVGVAASLGAYHHWFVVPRYRSVESGDREATLERRSRSTIVAEAIVLGLVVVMSALLTRSSTV